MIQNGKIANALPCDNGNHSKVNEFIPFNSFAHMKKQRELSKRDKLIEKVKRDGKIDTYSEPDEVLCNLYNNKFAVEMCAIIVAKTYK